MERTNSAGESVRLLKEIDSEVPDQWRGLYNFLLGTSYISEGEYDKGILLFNANINWQFVPKEYRFANVAMAYSNQKQHRLAISQLEQALTGTMYDTHGVIWMNLAKAKVELGDHQSAITSYKNALKHPLKNINTILNHLADLYSETDNFEEAAEVLNQIVDSPDFDNDGIIWSKLGAVYIQLEEFNAAETALLNAVHTSRYSTPAKGWRNLGFVYEKMARPDQAKDAYRNSLACKDTDEGDHAEARLRLLLLESRLESSALTDDDRALVDLISARTIKGGIESEIIDAINAAGESQYEKFISNANSNRDDILTIARGWSSAVTLLEGSERRWRGGGYFLKWRGAGIVIDPGFDFLRNFHDAGYHGREIRAVIVSHNHQDHNSDLKGIDDLSYELYKRLIVGGQTTHRPYILIWDEETSKATNFGFDKAKHHHTPIIMTAGMPQSINLLEHKECIPFRIVPFKVEHGDEVPSAMGMVLELLDQAGGVVVRIGYTGDTEYFPELHHHLANCDVLIAHISQPSIEELKDNTKSKRSHLGYRGVEKLITNCKPRLTLLGEFWAGLTDLRIPLTKGLRDLTGNASIFPSSISMHIQLPTLDIECTCCKKASPFAEMRVCPSTVEFGSLSYYCPSCVI